MYMFGISEEVDRIYLITVTSVWARWRLNALRLDCLSSCFRHKVKETSKLHVSSLLEVNPSVIGEFPSQMASSTKNVSI